MFSPSKDKRKQNQSLYSTAHIIKRKKRLLGDVTCLTNSVVKPVVIKCAQNINLGLAPSYILASLFTGRSLLQLLEANIEVPNEEPGGQMNRAFYLLSNWQHPVLKLPSKYLSYFMVPDSKGEVLLPLELLKAFQKSQDEDLVIEDLETEVKEFIQQNFAGLFQHINLTRIQNHFSHLAPKFGLSRADVAFIADYDLLDNPHCSYGLFDASHIMQKHAQYISSLIKEAGLSGFQVQKIDKKSFFGSHRVLKGYSVSDFFKYCVRQITRNPSTHAELLKSFNFYTFYVVTFLELGTLHRPILSEFGKLESFDLINGNVVIIDKGEQSYRVIPLSQTACTILNAYIKYLKNLISDLRFTYPEISNAIAGALMSDRGLFQLWDSRGIKPYHPNNVYTLIESIFPFPQNWARHYIATMLMNDGVSRNLIEAYMGHAPSGDQLYNEYSSFDFNHNRILSDKIDKHIIQDLNLPLII
ncbi:MAG: hypothetical protein NWQ54_06615 [Paraglaciecola sp.]|uniref:hypothetical protein n=1 Tax=Paraglaciecola sp. TaxID=1920173 RepID=UPI00273E694E|nr:hypothetical protein [Paraglaciecola sp.]MDP5033211.1 hypothetical protein [Paraglaciecola sp.]MDP5130538.1 hypothetical protein [Paraglaciecola sp.]